MASAAAPPTSPVRVYARLDARDTEIDGEWEAAYAVLEQLVAGKEAEAAAEAVQEAAARGAAVAARLGVGIMYGVMAAGADVAAQDELLVLLPHAVTDGYAGCADRLAWLVTNRWRVVRPSAQMAALRLVDHLLRMRIVRFAHVLGLIASTLAPAVMGPLAAATLGWLCVALEPAAAWLAAEAPPVLAACLIALLEMEPSLGSRGHTQLRTSVQQLTSRLALQLPDALQPAGADAVLRLTAPFPEWQIAHEAAAASVFCRYRLDPQLAARLEWMAGHVQVGSQGRYQTWLVTSRGWSTARSDATLAELTSAIRFAVRCLRARSRATVPPWMLAGWLVGLGLQLGLDRVDQLGTALVSDWLTFTGAPHETARLEPAALLLRHSLPDFVPLASLVLSSLAAGAEMGPDPKARASAAVGAVVAAGLIPSPKTVFAAAPLSPELRSRLSRLLPSQQALPEAASGRQNDSAAQAEVQQCGTSHTDVPDELVLFGRHLRRLVEGDAASAGSDRDTLRALVSHVLAVDGRKGYSPTALAEWLQRCLQPDRVAIIDAVMGRASPLRDALASTWPGASLAAWLLATNDSSVWPSIAALAPDDLGHLVTCLVTVWPERTVTALARLLQCSELTLTDDHRTATLASFAQHAGYAMLANFAELRASTGATLLAAPIHGSEPVFDASLNWEEETQARMWAVLDAELAAVDEPAALLQSLLAVAGASPVARLFLHRTRATLAGSNKRRRDQALS
ncbi:uncharacterized protein AMSG_00395 [Thecamonas trahens ATCC 50062]|uniref:Integrator complex subunit 3 N-terminal domain-containing protein n=1 Tax=Thecamonas trahens ATCC 50062 TaxID=461836 RepID=A0A0L0DBF3_THETB|nr:hypothetical protein AMSG_00395 [Thecamonas trahens ATCC 50062]KNC48618.1 hypothetical protein AMSG_00395 [Thecamonas trahens ATCC 50062]|eukprot:XP_013762674.1 hypothetical protein AMSG_00395 [Thecamonas trahens ATCC 50062]